MKILLFVFTCTALLILGSQEVYAQPGCRYSYGVSFECPDISGDTVVLGRVVRLTDIDRETGVHNDAKDLGGWPEGTVLIEVEQVFKGTAEAFIEFTVAGVFSFVDLPPGRYMIQVISRANGRSTSFYYPGVIYETDTLMIDLTVGQEMTGLLFKIPPH